MDKQAEKTVITIIGLGQIGTSIGLALQPYEERITRVGHTKKFGEANHAKSIGAVDKAALNLHDAVRNAAVVVLALPMHELKGVLQLISEDLKEGTVVLDTSPVPSVAAAWASEHLPKRAFFISFTPVLNPKNLLGPEHGIESARADLFHNGMFAVTAGPEASSEALKVGSDLASMMQAAPLFADAAEIDSYMASTHLLPQLMAASLAKINQASSGWGENRRVAGRAYAQLTNLLLNTDRAPSLAVSVLNNREHVLRVLDELLADLGLLKEEISEADQQTLVDRFEAAQQGREKWFQQRMAAQWFTDQDELMDLAQASSPLGQMFGGIAPRPKPKPKPRNQ